MPILVAGASRMEGHDSSLISKLRSLTLNEQDQIRLNN